MDFQIRNATIHDCSEILELSKLLNLYNLPNNRDLLEKKLLNTEKSFRGEIEEKAKNEYIFVLEDLSSKKIVGASLIIAKHGTNESPHTYFKVLKKKKESSTLNIIVEHEILRAGFDYDGPSEIGALVLKPEYRGHPKKLGKFLSFIRFMYVAAFRERFENHIHSELMPLFDEAGNSHLWEELGKKFTRMKYNKADTLSQSNKEFITSLFPEGDIYTCMLSQEARDSIGKVGHSTKPVEKMLKSIGFYYSNMIDPFDGGPHYWAQTDAILPVKNTIELKQSTQKIEFSKKGFLGIMNQSQIQFFHSEFAMNENNEIDLNNEKEISQGIKSGSKLYFLENNSGK